MKLKRINWFWTFQILWAFGLAISLSLIFHQIMWISFGMGIVVIWLWIATIVLKRIHEKRKQGRSNIANAIAIVKTSNDKNSAAYAAAVSTLQRLSATMSFSTTISLPSTDRFSGKVVEETQPYYGWRAYSLDNNAVISGVANLWPSNEMQAVCDRVTRDQTLEGLNNRQICIEHLENDSCQYPGCGIWGRHDLDSIQGNSLIIAWCMAYGIIALDEDKNWRASDVRIEKLFINKSGITESWRPYTNWEQLAFDLYIRYMVPIEIVNNPKEIQQPPTLQCLSQ